MEIPHKMRSSLAVGQVVHGDVQNICTEVSQMGAPQYQRDDAALNTTLY